jgi:hypothetical protein
MVSNQRVKDTAKVERVEFPPEGGTFTYLKGHPYPFPGFPDKGMVESSRWIKKFWPAMISAAHSLLKSQLIKPERYSKPVKEIYRLFNILIEREKEEYQKTKWTQMRDVICHVLEFDNAYRFRFQDVLSELNLDEIKPDEATRYYMSLHDDYNFSAKQHKNNLNKNNATKKGSQ